MTTSISFVRTLEVLGSVDSTTQKYFPWSSGLNLHYSLNQVSSVFSIYAVANLAICSGQENTWAAKRAHQSAKVGNPQCIHLKALHTLQGRCAMCVGEHDLKFRHCELCKNVYLISTILNVDSLEQFQTLDWTSAVCSSTAKLSLHQTIVGIGFPIAVHLSSRVSPNETPMKSVVSPIHSAIDIDSAIQSQYIFSFLSLLKIINLALKVQTEAQIIPYHEATKPIHLRCIDGLLNP